MPHRTSCRRCFAKKKKCDKAVPTCSVCMDAGEVGEPRYWGGRGRLVVAAHFTRPDAKETLFPDIPSNSSPEPGHEHPSGTRASANSLSAEELDLLISNTRQTLETLEALKRNRYSDVALHPRSTPSPGSSSAPANSTSATAAALNNSETSSCPLLRRLSIGQASLIIRSITRYQSLTARDGHYYRGPSSLAGCISSSCPRDVRR
jgi:hypothetical protein